MQHSVPIKWFYDGNIWKAEARFSGTTLELLFLVNGQCLTLNGLQSATDHRSLLYALNDSAPPRQSQSTFTSRVRVLRVRRSGGRAIPRVRSRQQWGSFIHTIGSHSISRSAQKNNSSSSSSDEWWRAPSSAALERGSKTGRERGAGTVERRSQRRKRPGRMRNHCWTGRDLPLLLYVNIAR